MTNFNIASIASFLSECGFVSDTAENRAQNIHAMFADPEVKAIFSAIGGDPSCDLLPHLDFDLIRANPKIFVGYSDTHILSVAIWTQTSLVTFVGPAILTDFAEYPSMFDYTGDYLMRLLTRSEPIRMIEPSPWWTEEFLDWVEKKDLERPRAQQPSDGWAWLKSGEAEGVLIGGCLESLQHLRGTRFWPDWKDAIFFIETSEMKPTARSDPRAYTSLQLSNQHQHGFWAHRAAVHTAHWLSSAD